MRPNLKGVAKNRKEKTMKKFLTKKVSITLPVAAWIVFGLVFAFAIIDQARHLAALGM